MTTGGSWQDPNGWKGFSKSYLIIIGVVVLIALFYLGRGLLTLATR